MHPVLHAQPARTPRPPRPCFLCSAPTAAVRAASLRSTAKGFQLDYLSVGEHCASGLPPPLPCQSCVLAACASLVPGRVFCASGAGCSLNLSDPFRSLQGECQGVFVNFQPEARASRTKRAPHGSPLLSAPSPGSGRLQGRPPPGRRGDPQETSPGSKAQASCRQRSGAESLLPPH